MYVYQTIFCLERSERKRKLMCLSDGSARHESTSQTASEHVRHGGVYVRAARHALLPKSDYRPAKLVQEVNQKMGRSRAEDLSLKAFNRNNICT